MSKYRTMRLSSLIIHINEMEKHTDWWKYPRTMYKSRINLPRINNGKIQVGQYGPQGPYQNDLDDLYGNNPTFILFCMYFGVIDNMEKAFNKRAMTEAQRLKRNKKELDNILKWYNNTKK